MNINIPWQCEKILKRFNEHDIEAYLVGGCVRDSLLGKEPKDWDICTNATPTQIKKIFSRNTPPGINCYLLFFNEFNPITS